MKKYVLIMTSTEVGTGAPVDRKLYLQFFQSIYGGCWNNEEIGVVDTSLSKIKWEEKLDSLKKKELDYFVFVYSGHGGLTRDGQKTYWRLDSGEYVDGDSLSPLAKRQLRIFDCCRASAEDLRLIECFQSMVKTASYVDRTLVRDSYESAVGQAPEVLHVLYSCLPHQCSYGEQHTGSVFTRWLMASTYAWLDDIEKQHLNPMPAYVDVRLVFELTRNVMSKRPCQEELLRQTPEAILPQKLPALPWAMIPSGVMNLR